MRFALPRLPVLSSGWAGLVRIWSCAFGRVPNSGWEQSGQNLRNVQTKGMGPGELPLLCNSPGPTIGHLRAKEKEGNPPGAVCPLLRQPTMSTRLAHQARPLG